MWGGATTLLKPTLPLPVAVSYQCHPDLGWDFLPTSPLCAGIVFLAGACTGLRWLSQQLCGLMCLALCRSSGHRPQPLNTYLTPSSAIIAEAGEGGGCVCVICVILGSITLNVNTCQHMNFTVEETYQGTHW